MINIVLPTVCTSRKNDGIFLKRQNLKIPQYSNAMNGSESFKTWPRLFRYEDPFRPDIFRFDFEERNIQFSGTQL